MKNIYRCIKRFISHCDRGLTEFILLYSSVYCILCTRDLNTDDINESKELLHRYSHKSSSLFSKYTHVIEYYFCPDCVRKLLFSLSKVIRCTFCSGFYTTESKVLPADYHKGLTLTMCKEKHDMPFVLNYSLLPFFDFLHDIYIKAKYNNQLLYLHLLFLLGFNKSTYQVLHHLSSIIDIIIPVPMSFQKRLDRNYSVSDLFAKNLSKLMGKKVFFLLKEKGRSYQHLKRKSDATDRYVIKQRYKKKYFLSNKAVLLVDDIYTTGSTMKTCAQICKDAGAEKIYTVTLFRTIYASSNI